MKNLIKLASLIVFGLLAGNSAAKHHNLTKKDNPQLSWESKTPWIIPTDTATAMNEPDRYAWQLFVSLSWPTHKRSCHADNNKTLGDKGLTVWETWAAREQIFLDNAEKPKSWRNNCRNNYEALPKGDVSDFKDETVRMNKKAHNFIRDNELYSLDEQERLAKLGVRDIDFPIGSKEIKAHWTIIDEYAKPRYHWVEVERENETIIYGLTALHITSKDLPTWFWATFEHVDNEYYWPTVHREKFGGWGVASADSAACPKNNLACNEVPKGFGLEGTKWENYRLRGTQIDWVDNRGEPVVLANSQIEGFMVQETVSCLSCHAFGVKGASGDVMPIRPFTGEVTNGLPHGYVGALDPSLFKDENGEKVQYLGLDYVWALRNAKRKNN